MAKKTLTIQIDSDVLDNFRAYCKLNALKLSAKVELLIKQEMDNAKNNPTLIQMFKDILNEKKFQVHAGKPEQKHIEQNQHSMPHRQVEASTVHQQAYVQAQPQNIIQQQRPQHIEIKPITEVRQVIQQIQEKNQPRPDSPKHIDKKPAPTLDQLRYRRGL